MENTYINLNSEVNFYDADHKIQFDKDKAAAKAYFLEHVNPKTVFFHNLDEKLKYLVENNYYETEFLSQYSDEFLHKIYDYAYSYKFRFKSFVGAYKFFRQYGLKTFDGENYLERYEDRVVANALLLADGNEDSAMKLVDEIITGRFQPATPTFLNAGKKQRGEYVSCYLVNVEDSMNSIGRAVNTALQLSKRGGGIAFNLTDLRCAGDPIKKMENQASGVVPVMKIIESSVRYSNQLGQRDGSAAVYLNLFHKDIETFLDSRRENADDAIRITRLSIGVVIPDIFFELVKNNEDMYVFSPYDVSKKYSKPFSDVNVSEVYRDLVDDKNVKKKKFRARQMLTRLAETQVESGYPYIMFEDTVNKANNIAGKIKQSNLCSEILQVQLPSSIDDDQEYNILGKDISCNLGSINIANIMVGSDFGSTIETAIRALSRVADIADITTAPSIQNGNQLSKAVGLGAMNLHGYLAMNNIEYGSDDALDFVDVYFMLVTYHAIRASMLLAKETGRKFDNFENSRYATGEFFHKYWTEDHLPKSKTVEGLFSDHKLPCAQDWQQLSDDVQNYGMYNQNLQAVAPTGSIAYINHATPSMLPVTAKIETRKEGMMGQVYWPSPGLTNDNVELYKDGYEVGWKAIIDTYAAAQQHVDQGMSLTLFFNQDATTREINQAQIYAWRKGIKTLYYIRIKMNVMGGLESSECVSCAI